MRKENAISSIKIYINKSRKDVVLYNNINYISNSCFNESSEVCRDHELIISNYYR